MATSHTSLRLRYAFVSSPNPIRASAAGADPNSIGLTVMISDPGTDPVVLAGIIIEIPVGEESARALSSLSLPAPTSGTASAWTLSIDGSRLVMQPAAGSTAQITDTILITFPGITVNHTPGVVPISITEIHPSGDKSVDGRSYSLTKLEADFPVTDFHATPVALYNLDQTATLYWSTSDQGKTLSYGLSSPGWQPTDCLNQKNCYGWQDGQSGITTPPLRDTTLFTLSVIGTTPAGGRVLLTTLSITVRVEMPAVVPNSYIEQVATSRFVVLHWIAINAVRCKVFMDGQLIDAHAPTDTYVHGYPLLLPPDVAGSKQFTVIAYSDSGAQAAYSFSPVSINPATSLHVGGNVCGIAITPDSQLALVAHMLPGYRAAVTAIDIPTRQAEPAAIPIPIIPEGIAITPDGRSAVATSFGIFGSAGAAVADAVPPDFLPAGSTAAGSSTADALPAELIAHHTALSRSTAPEVTPDVMPAASLSGASLAATGSSGYATFIDVASRSALPARVPLPGPFGPAITPDGRYAVVSELIRSAVAMVDIAARSLAASIPAGTFGGMAVAVTPDGKLALALAMKSVAVIDIATRTAEPNHIQLGMRPMSIAITPDSRLALVIGAEHDVMVVIDIPGRRTEGTTIPVPRVEYAAKQAIAITPDGRYALVASRGGIVTIVDIGRRAIIPGTISIIASASIAVTPDGMATIVGGSLNDTVTIL